MLGEINENEHMLRAVWPNYIRSDGTIKSAAFKPRSRETGVSVERTGTRSLETATTETKEMFPQGAIVSVSVPDCIAAQTYLVPDPSNRSQYHTQIFSNPEMLPLDPIQWDNLASVARVQIRAED